MWASQKQGFRDGKVSFVLFTEAIKATVAKVTFFAVCIWMSFVRTCDQEDLTIEHCEDQIKRKKYSGFAHIRLLAVKWQ